MGGRAVAYKRAEVKMHLLFSYIPVKVRDGGREGGLLVPWFFPHPLPHIRGGNQAKLPRNPQGREASQDAPYQLH